MTSIAAFMPLFFVEGMMGKFMSVMPVIVISVLLLSLIESLFILPAHLSSKGDGPVSRLFRRVFIRPLDWHARAVVAFDRGLKYVIRNAYQPTLRLALAHPISSAALALSLMLCTAGLVTGGHIKFVFMPEIGSDWVTISVNMPQGTTATQTAKVVQHIEEKAIVLRDQIDAEREASTRAQPRDGASIYRNVFTYIGDQPTARRSSFSSVRGAGGQGHLAEVTIELLPSEERDLDSAEIEARLRQLVGEVPGPESIIFSSSLFSVGNPIEVELASDNFDQLLLAVERLKGKIAEYSGTGDIQDSFEEGKLEMKLQLKPQARTLGLTLADLARQVRQGFYGDQALRFQRGSDDVRVMVRYPKDERRNLGDVRSMRVRTPSGAEVPFAEVATGTIGHAYASIQRTDGQRVVRVSASVDDQIANADEINRDLEAFFLPALVQDYPGLRYSFGGEQKERDDSLQSLLFNFIIALAAIYVLLAVPFKSYTQPLVVMSAIPFGIIGAVWGHLLMGLDLALLSLFGIVALSGVVVNDSLVLLTFYNQLRREGTSHEDALVSAGFCALPSHSADLADDLLWPAADDSRKESPSAVFDSNGRQPRLWHPLCHLHHFVRRPDRNAPVGGSPRVLGAVGRGETRRGRAGCRVLKGCGVIASAQCKWCAPSRMKCSLISTCLPQSGLSSRNSAALPMRCSCASQEVNRESTRILDGEESRRRQSADGFHHVERSVCHDADQERDLPPDAARRSADPSALLGRDPSRGRRRRLQAH